MNLYYVWLWLWFLVIKGKKAFIFKEDISWDDRSPWRVKKFLYMSKKNYTLSNHSASGHQLESCTFKGFDPYIYTYIHTKYPHTKYIQSIHIHIYTPPRPKVQAGRTSTKCPTLIGLKGSRKSSGIRHGIENHGFLPTSSKILYYRKNYFLS